MMSESIDKLNELIKGIRIAMLTTVAAEGSLHSRPMATQDARSEGDLWFFTSTHTHKCDEIEAEHHVNLAYADPDKHRYVSVAGLASVIDDRQKAHALWSPMMKAWFPDGPDSEDLILLRVRIHSVEYWDTKSSKMVQLAGFAKAVLTGKRYEGEGAEHERFELDQEPTPRFQ